MSDSFIDQVRGLMFSPGAALERYGDRDLWTGLVYYLKLLCVSAVLSAVLYLFQFLISGAPQIPFAYMAFLSLILSLVWNLISVLIDSLLCFTGVCLVGGRAGLEKTALAVMYSYTPVMLLGVVPGIVMAVSGANVFAISTEINHPGLAVAGVLTAVLWIWALFIRVKGIMVYHELLALRAIIALVVELAIVVIIWMLLVALVALPVVFGRY